MLDHLAADIRIGSDSAYFRAAGINNGLTANELGVSYLLPRQIGFARAFDILLSGRDVSAEEAERIGLLSQMVPGDQLLERCYELAEGIIGFSHIGVELTKQLLWASLDAGSLHSHMNHEGNAQLYVRMMNDALAGEPADLVVGVHMCRGNHASSWVAEGGYDPIAEQVFGEMKVAAFFLEYDSPRAGGFAPLRYLTGSKVAVLGLVTTKKGALESKAEIRRRIEEASRYVPMARLALSPQCGFASTIAGNALSEDDQRRKLELVVTTAREVWGG